MPPEAEACSSTKSSCGRAEREASSWCRVSASRLAQPLVFRSQLNARKYMCAMYASEGGIAESAELALVVRQSLTIHFPAAVVAVVGPRRLLRRFEVALSLIVLLLADVARVVIVLQSGLPLV